MLTSYAGCAEQVRRLHEAVLHLECASALLKLKPLNGRPWFEVLTKKLVPQLTDDAFLVVAVVGGTNIGKSVVFNHIAGFRASATSPLASGTKHPVCLVPTGFAQRHDLASIFPGFKLEEWTVAEAALEETSEDRLMWRTSPDTPDNLLILDTPDIDSDAEMNWQRADHIRHCADVMIAVLTQQKYNDAAVKRFFRNAAAEDKAVVVLFNQCQWPEDARYWPLWLDTFCRETNIAPEIVYVAPSDRRAAEEIRLPFYDVTGLVPVGAADAAPRSEEPPTDAAQHSLRDDLSRLRFSEIKMRSLRGSMRKLLSNTEGVPAYLKEIADRSAEFQAAGRLLAAHRLAEIDDWPTLSNSDLIDALREWWRLQRSGWSATVHAFYNTVGKGLAWPIRKVSHRLRGEPEPAMDVYRRREWTAILEAVEEVYETLTSISDLESELLRPRLKQLLSGTSRAQLVKQLEQEHAAVDLERELDDLVQVELRSFQDESPQLYRLLRRVDTTAAAARPATSLVLFVTGFGPVGHALGPFVADSAMHAVIPVVGDFAGGTIAAAVGDTALSTTAGKSVGYLEAKLRRLHYAFASKRVAWLALMLKKHLLGTLPEELQEAATLPQSEAFLETKQALKSLEEALEAQGD